MTQPSTIGMIWDLDGTLADTEQAHFKAWQTFCSRHGRTLTWDQFKPTFGLGNVDILRILIAPNLTDAELDRLSDEKESIFRHDPNAHFETMPGARELVAHLHALGIPQAIGSSAPAQNIPYVLRSIGLEDMFEVMASRWDVSAGKPAPDIFLLSATRLEIPAIRCIVLEDAPAGVQAAHAAGMACIALASTWPEAALSQAELVVRDFAEVMWDRATFEAFAAHDWKPEPNAGAYESVAP